MHANARLGYGAISSDSTYNQLFTDTITAHKIVNSNLHNVITYYLHYTTAEI